MSQENITEQDSYAPRLKTILTPELVYSRLERAARNTQLNELSWELNNAVSSPRVFVRRKGDRFILSYRRTRYDPLFIGSLLRMFASTKGAFRRGDAAGGVPVRAWCDVRFEGLEPNTVILDFGNPLPYNLLPVCLLLSAIAVVPLTFMPDVAASPTLLLLLYFYMLAAALQFFLWPRMQWPADREKLRKWVEDVLNAPEERSLQLGDVYSQSRGHPLRWASLAVAGISFAILFGALEPLLPYVVRWIPVQKEIAWGQELVPPQETIIRDAKMNAALTRIGKRLLATVPDQPYPIRFTLVRSREANAFAAPGGNIVVFTGLMGEVNSADELAGILAHEIQHVLLRHSLKNYLNSKSRKLAEEMSSTVRVMNPLFELRFSRQQESEADRKALEMLAAAGLDTGALESFFERLSKMTGSQELVSRLLSTHPSDAERMALLARWRKALFPVAKKPLEVDWAEFKRRAVAESKRKGKEIPFQQPTQPT